MKDILGSLPGIFKDVDPEGLAVEPVVFAAWKRCVDGALAGHVVPLRLERNRLIAAVATETWRKNVADLGPELAARINAAAGAPLVRFIEFQVNPEAVLEHRERIGSGNTESDEEMLAAQITPGIEKAAESIGDEELRSRFLAAAANNLARQQADNLVEPAAD